MFRDEPARQTLAQFDYWCLARCDDGWRLECAGTGKVQRALSNLLGHDLDSQLSLPDGSLRAAKFDGDRLHSALIVAKNRPVEVDRTHLAGLIGVELDAAGRASVLAGRAAHGESAGPIICSCEGVGRYTLLNALQDGARTIGDLGDRARAGTNCGSCQPELRKIISEFNESVAQPAKEEAV